MYPCVDHGSRPDTLSAAPAPSSSAQPSATGLLPSSPSSPLASTVSEPCAHHCYRSRSVPSWLSSTAGPPLLEKSFSFLCLFMLVNNCCLSDRHL